MRILVLTTDAFGGYGGIALYNRDFLKALCAYPNCTEIVSIPRLMNNFSEKLPEKLTYVTNGINSKLRYIFTVFEVLLKNPRFDLIVCSHINLLPLAYIIRILLNAPLILVIYGIEAWKSEQNWLRNHFVKKIDSYISISEVTEQRFLRWASIENKQNFILPNAIHATYYGPGPKKKALLTRYGLKGKTVLMTLGRLDPGERYKGYDEMLELLPELTFEIPNIAYIIVGDGEDRYRLEKKAQTLGVANRVIFTGYVPESEKANYYRLADAFVMPGRGEGFGFVLLEAMACGIPVVASKADGSREAVRNGDLGIIVDPKDQNEIKAGVLQALKSPKVVPDGLEYFSFENFTHRLHSIIDKLLKSKQSPNNVD